MGLVEMRSVLDGSGPKPQDAVAYLTIAIKKILKENEIQRHQLVPGQGKVLPVQQAGHLIGQGPDLSAAALSGPDMNINQMFLPGEILCRPVPGTALADGQIGQALAFGGGVEYARDVGHQLAVPGQPVMDGLPQAL